MNKAIIIGNLGKDPEIRTTADGKKVATFSVATSRKRNTREGKQEVTTWHNIVMFEPFSIVAEKYLTKGDKVAIVGEIQNRTWQTKEGETRYVFEIIANEMEMLGSNNRSEDKQPQVASNSPSQKDDDDLPF